MSRTSGFLKSSEFFWGSLRKSKVSLKYSQVSVKIIIFFLRIRRLLSVSDDNLNKNSFRTPVRSPRFE